MPVTEVTVQYLNKREGKRPPSIKDAQAGYFGITDEMFDQGVFSVGNKYKVEYTQNGAFKNVSRAKLLAEGPPPQAHSGGSGDPGLAERIFVCGALNAILGNDNVNPMEIGPDNITSWVDSCRQAWDRTFGRKPETPPPHQSAKAAPRDDMNDEIPW